MSSSHGSFLARICAAICSITFDGDTWNGSAVTTMLLASLVKVARARTLPLPVSYMFRRSLAAVMISALDG
ncbi:hypothetical protein G6F24_018712 [Rhizopus arrhizus]|nr:hypothetical protein G6F24_018712 [Rhizopus arrhizus]